MEWSMKINMTNIVTYWQLSHRYSIARGVICVYIFKFLSMIDEFGKAEILWVLSSRCRFLCVIASSWKMFFDVFLYIWMTWHVCTYIAHMHFNVDLHLSVHLSVYVCAAWGELGTEAVGMLYVCSFTTAVSRTSPLPCAGQKFRFSQSVISAIWCMQDIASTVGSTENINMQI